MRALAQRWRLPRATCTCAFTYHAGALQHRLCPAAAAEVHGGGGARGGPWNEAAWQKQRKSALLTSEPLWAHLPVSLGWRRSAPQTVRWALFPLEEGLLFPWDSGSNGVGRVRVPWGWRFRLVWCGAGLLDHRNTPENLREAVRRTISGSKGRLHFVDLGHTTRVLSWSLRPGTPASQHGFAGKKNGTITERQA